MDENIVIENVEPDCCRTMRMEADMKRGRLAQQRQAWECLKFFEQTPRTEVQFYMRYETLPREDVTLLKSFYGVSTDAELFVMICRFWNVSFDC